MKNRILSINITTSTIIKTIVIIIVLWFLYYIRGIVGIFLVSLLLTAALKPLIDWLESKKIPRSIGITLLYLIIFGITVGAFILIIPPMVEQLKELAINFPSYWNKIMQTIGWLREYSHTIGWLDNLNKIASNIEDNLSKVAGNIFAAVSSVFGGVVSFIFILVITFYMTLEKKAAERIVSIVIHGKYQERTLKILKNLEEKIGLWLRGQVVLMFIIGLMAFIGLLILRIEYALTLGLIAGLTEIVPYLGPILGAIPAVFLAFTQSPYKAIAVIILYFGIQELEANLIAPKVMEKAVGLNPIISIFALLIGAKIAGIPGVLLSIPFATSLIVVIKEFYPNIKGKKTKTEVV